MRTQLLGLPLKQAEAILSEEGVHPQVSETYARFLDPISDPQP